MAMRVEGFAVNGNFRVNRAVVVENSIMHHGVGGHDRLAGIPHLVGVAGTASLVGDPQVAGIQETNKLGGLEVQPGLQVRNGLSPNSFLLLG